MRDDLSFIPLVMQQFSFSGQEPEQVKMSFGALLEERSYRARTFKSVFGFLVALVVAVVGAVKVFSILDFMGISAFFERFFSHDYWMWAAMLVGGLIGIIGQIFRAVRNKGAMAELFEKGVYIKANGKELAYAFADISYLWIQLTDHYTNGIKTWTTVESSLETRNGQQVKFNINLFSKAGDFANAFSYAYEQARLADVMEEFKAWKPQTFGALTLTKEGIETPKGFLAWSDLMKVETLYGGFSFRFLDQQKKKIWVFQWKEIPNRGIFLGIILEKTPEVEFKS